MKRRSMRTECFKFTPLRYELELTQIECTWDAKLQFQLATESNVWDIVFTMRKLARGGALSGKENRGG